MLALGLAGGWQDRARRARWPRCARRGSAPRPGCRPTWPRCTKGLREAEAITGMARLPEGVVRRPVGAGSSGAATRPRASARSAAAMRASSPPIRSRRRPNCWSGWHRRWPRSAARCCRPRDELASSQNMVIGAAYGGVPSLTATAGPGLALMTEAIGLAGPPRSLVVVVDVMRGGPSTGIPAKSEQSDLSFAVSGLHGDAPRPGARADVDRRLRGDHAVGGAPGRGAAGAGDRALGPVHGPVARDHRSAGRPGPVAQRPTVAANSPDYKRATATRRPASRRWRSRNARRDLHRRRPRAQRGRDAEQPAGARPLGEQLDKRERKLALHDYGAGDGPTSRATAETAVITFG